MICRDHAQTRLALEIYLPFYNVPFSEFRGNSRIADRTAMSTDAYRYHDINDIVALELDWNSIGITEMYLFLNLKT